MRKKKPKKSTKPPSESRALVPLDALQRYLNKIGEYSLLSPEEEHDLAIRYVEQKDPKAAYELTVRNLRLVVKIAMEYRKAWSNVLDLIQEGNIGLMTAIQRFDPYRQIRLSTYSSWWIRAYILKFIMDNWRLIKIGNTQAERKLFYNLRREQEKLLSEGFSPGPKLLAQRLQVKESDVVEMSKRLGTSEVPLDQPRSFQKSSGDEGTSRSIAETVAGSEETLDEAFAESEIRQIIQKVTRELRKKLKPREIHLLDRRILAEEPVTLREIGEEWGVSRERVRQLEEQLLKKMKVYISKNYPDVAASFTENS